MSSFNTKGRLKINLEHAQKIYIFSVFVSMEFIITVNNSSHIFFKKKRILHTSSKIKKWSICEMVDGKCSPK